MAIRSKKDTLTEDAQKFVQRGQFDKAAKTYEQILAIDPSAISVRQKLAELLIKSGFNDDARKEFEIIGKHFSKNGFNLKAIAVYKQLQKIFPADISLSVTLAELNEKHGLAANALSEYKLVYEYHEKAGNIPEALSILDRMQKVDPHNIPIKIKLAEAYAQQENMGESYALFSKTASLLSERGDVATLSKISTRILHLFPDKPDFMLEILAEQIHQGNAASAIENLQGLLRSNPKNKHAWDLAILAYQNLEQPQRVKIACQHYLKFFPAEPAAMHGLISSIVAERNLAGALELLDQYESPLISAGYLPQLEQTYQALDKIDPINTRVLEGLIRVTAATGNENEVRLLKSKLQSLHSVSGVVQQESSSPESQPVFFEGLPLDTLNNDESPFFEEISATQTTVTAAEVPETGQLSAASSGTEHKNVAAEVSQQLDDGLEIDIEIDMDSSLDSLNDTSEAAADHGNWLDSVGDLFNTIDTAPRGVKFGNEMENSDAQSHFDLGMAFKEMGLYDEAMNEFSKASQDSSRRLECLIMLCSCLRERGEAEKAITTLQALLKPGLGEDQFCAVTYELASAYEAAGKNEEANILLNEIYATNPHFRDISSRINAANATDSLDFTDDDLDDFTLN